MALRLYDTGTRTKVELRPIDETAVRLYVCGSTVYDLAHIGNARPLIVFDVLFRLLRQIYGETRVVYARNVTDVDDKINLRAFERGLSIRELTEGTAAQFHEDVDALGCLPPTHEPRATDHMPEMVAMIERLVARGVAYVAQDHVLFSVAAMDRLAAEGAVPRYGALARRSLDEMLAGARVDVATYKRDPMDFVLWKPSREAHEPGWPSPAGIAQPGRPGWHIECSAMSMAKLLEPFGGGLSCEDPSRNVFDIHGGGIDLVFPHHENEVAQSCCAFGTQRMAAIWMHNGFLQVEGEKMSKSSGNFITIRDLTSGERVGGRSWPGPVLRLAMLRTHYRQPIDWTLDALKEAEAVLDRWEVVAATAGEAEARSPAVLDALSDDLNTPEAIALLHRAAASGDGAAVWSGLVALGLNAAGRPGDLWARRQDREQTLVRRLKDRHLDIQKLLDERTNARQARDWAESDRIRDTLSAQGVVIKDHRDGTTSYEVRP